MNVLTVDYRSKDAAKDFSRSLKETGFAVVKNHPLSKELVDAVYAEWKAFFSQDEATKRELLFDKEKQDGFFPVDVSETAKGYTVKDIKEFYHFYAWGRHPKNLSNKTSLLFNEMSQVAETLLSWVEEYLPKEIAENLHMPLSKMISDSPMTLMRVIHYPPLSGSEPEGAIRAAEHEDIDHLTILPAATAAGLQVKDAQGNWHDVVSDPGTIVVNAGDMLQECTAGYYRSTTHRVCNPMGQDRGTSRLSMPLFLHARDEVRLSERYTAESYLDERLKELGLR